MIKRSLISTFLAVYLFGCGHGQNGNQAPSKINLVLLGYDSIVSYYGNSSNLVNSTRGRISDSTFMATTMASLKEHTKSGPLLISLKPTAGADVINNLKQVVDQLNQNDLQNRSLDTLDEFEKKFFNTISLQEAVAQSKEAVNHLHLPRDENDQQSIEDSATGHRLIILIFEQNGVYAYSGKDISSGKKYTYDALKSLLASKKEDGTFSVVIRASPTSTYKNTVDMLDVMTIEGIKKYKLTDISKEEEDYLNKIR